MKETFKITLFGIIFYSFLSSCTTETKFDAQDIYGNWEVIAAKRNNRLTQTLEDGYFKFQEEGSLETNIFGSDESFKITLLNDVIQQSGSRDTEYKIIMLQNDTLHLSATIQNLDFDFLAIKRDSL